MKFKINWKQIASLGVLIAILVVVMVLTEANEVQYYEIPKNEVNESNKEDTQDIDDDIKSDSQNEIKDEPKAAVVYVCGAVKTPMVIELTVEHRLNDAVELAGGLVDKADKEGVNLAMKLVDGAQYIIPTIGEDLVINYDGSKDFAVEAEGLGENSSSDKININLADEEKLSELSGIGEVLSKRIIDYRNEHNGFKSIDELKLVEGIGEKKFENIRDNVEL